MINVLHAEEYHRPDFNEMIELTANLIEEYNISFSNNDRIFIDGANSSVIRAIKARVNEDTDYEQQITYYRKTYGSAYNLESLMHNMFIIPIPFAKHHKQMLAHCKEIIESDGQGLAIHPRFNKLITSLRTAVEKGEGSLSKEETSHNDVFDAFRLSLILWHV